MAEKQAWAILGPSFDDLENENFKLWAAVIVLSIACAILLLT